MDVRRAREVLKAAGLPRSALAALAWPFRREQRVRLLLRQRLAVLEAKNNIVDYLSHAQGQLAELALESAEQVRAALREEERRRLIIGMGVSRAMLEEELASRYGSEVGRALDEALAELLTEGLVLQVPAEAALAPQEVYLYVHGRGRPHYEVAELNQMLREGRQYGAELRSRVSRDDSSKYGRTYRL